jgi:hypothetical protein
MVPATVINEVPVNDVVPAILSIKEVIPEVPAIPTLNEVIPINEVIPAVINETTPVNETVSAVSAISEVPVMAKDITKTSETSKGTVYLYIVLFFKHLLHIHYFMQKYR